MKKLLQDKLITLTSILLILLSITACEKIELNDPFSCKIGVRYSVDDNLFFTIDSIRDYRCPKGVFCIWSGDVDMFFSIEYNLSKIDTTIYLWTRHNNPFTIADHTWNINKVTPWLDIEQTPKQPDYRINLTITKE